MDLIGIWLDIGLRCEIRTQKTNDADKPLAALNHEPSPNSSSRLIQDEGLLGTLYETGLSTASRVFFFLKSGGMRKATSALALGWFLATSGILVVIDREVLLECSIEDEPRV